MQQTPSCVVLPCEIPQKPPKMCTKHIGGLWLVKCKYHRAAKHIYIHSHFSIMQWEPREELEQQQKKKKEVNYIENLYDL